MQIQINTDSNIDSGEKLIRHVEEEIASTLERFSDQITSVEAHLSDQNAGKGGPDDKRCVLQARPTGQQPVAVTRNAATIDDACRGAAEHGTSARQPVRPAARDKGWRLHQAPAQEPPAHELSQQHRVVRY